MLSPVEQRRAAAGAWLLEDPDPQTRAELQRLLDAEDDDALRERFGARLQFGTAGLRGPLGAGPNRMNRALVRRAAAGLAAALPSPSPYGPIVVGHDARHRSAEFAEDTARVLAGAGHRVLALGQCPTPLLAHAVLHHQAIAGVMVTASHNPASDNGYKVYWRDGAQIVPPADQAISSAIDAVRALGDVALASADDPRIEVAGVAVTDAYLRQAVGLLRPHGPRAVSVVYTPIHGVAGDLVGRSFASAGFPPPHLVAEQWMPDPDFPTAPFPNPEEPGVLDLAIRRAREAAADVVLANDPDGDRLAVAVPTADGWRALTGDEIGVILATHLLEDPRLDAGTAMVATTVVSSTLLAQMASQRGVAFAETLTGFKWVARAADGTGRRLAFGYEEALGYCIGDGVRDKDGISAALVLAEVVAGLRAAGRSVSDLLDDVARRFGLHHTSARSLLVGGVDGAQRMAAIMRDLREHPPRTLGGHVVERVEDLLLGTRLPPADVLRWFLEDGSRLVVRPSGTESKLKVYVEVREPFSGGRVEAAARAEALLDEAVGSLGLT